MFMHITVAEMQQAGLNPFDETALPTTEATSTSISSREKISFDGIAKRLLEENLILTALELHTELLESGKELKRLRDFFSNPSNFECQTAAQTGESVRNNLLRTSSVQTFDSFEDFTPPSEDGDNRGDDKIAVLEFELRKAKETIKSLREQLTAVSESEDGQTSFKVPTVKAGSADWSTQRSADLSIPVKPHERRALNYLIYEFLLQQNYKMTSVTFSDEVGDQDFEDWDDVGLNVPRPADIVHLYREFCHANNFHAGSTRDVAVSADIETDTNPFAADSMAESTELLNRLNHENSLLLGKTCVLENEIERLSGELERKTEEFRQQTVKPAAPHPELTAHPLPPKIVRRSLASVSAAKGQTAPDWEVKRSVPRLFQEKILKLAIKSSENASNAEIVTELNRLETNALNEAELVAVYADSLPRIVPHVLLNKREELIPIILCTAILHSDPQERDRLLNLMFNLIKKPEEEQREIILHGLAVYAQRVGTVRTEAELLPQCWEQINHKYPERRVLVAETCGALAPYIPPALLSSLVLSMLQQIINDDKTEAVRESAVKSLAVLCMFIEDGDKLNQVVDLLHKCLADNYEQVATAAELILLPSCSQWAYEIGKFQLGVVSPIMHKLMQLSSSPPTVFENLSCVYLKCLRDLIPLLYWSVLSSGPYMIPQAKPDVIESVNAVPLLASRYPVRSDCLDDLLTYAVNVEQLSTYTTAFDALTSKEWYQSWDCFDFVFRDMLPNVLMFLGKMDVKWSRNVTAAVNLFRHICSFFGRSVSNSKIKPMFLSAMAVPNQIVSHLNVKDELEQFSICHATFPVFIVGVMCAFNTDADKKEMGRYLKQTVQTYAASPCFTNAVVCTFAELSASSVEMELLLDLIWELVMHKTSAVRQLCAKVLNRLVKLTPQSLLKTKVVPALITLASDEDQDVKIATVQSFVALLEVAADDVAEKVRMQLASFLEDSSSNTDSALLICVIRMLAQIAPSVDVKFRDEFVLPRLAVVAATNNHETDAAVKQSVAVALFEAYSALSCCFLGRTVILESFLPGAKSLYRDLGPEHANIIASIIRDFETKVTVERGFERRDSMGTAEMPSVDVMKTRVMDRFKDFKDKMDQTKDVVPGLFKKSKP